MAPFTRQEATNWNREVPGTRWFKADLHIHTVDDIRGKNAKMPDGINGPKESPNTISAYARRFLQKAAERGVRVLGLTPHSPLIGEAPETSAVWRIVEEWNSGVDDDGVPFRENIYAVFPGFEPSFKDGKKGLHLLFLFDPEIGRANYLKAFDLVMGGVSPWPDGPDNQLRMSNKSADEAFRELRDFHSRERPAAGSGGSRWSYMALAPHMDTDKGLLKALRAQVMDQFPHHEVASLELGDQKLPADSVSTHAGLETRMAEHRQAFFHASDAYTVDEIGKRYTWLKLASPRIEALRQAFIASDSRLRIGYERGANSKLAEIPNPPDVTMNQRPWLRSVTVSGKASFFGDGDEGGVGTRFYLSPDLTCVIGGSMTGKSTFLDGLRVHIDALRPQDDGARKQVEERGELFLGGSPQVVLDCPGTDPTAPLSEQWPAEFYTQSELQRMAQDPQSVEDILSRLAASETQDIETREKRLVELDKELARTARRLAKLDDDLTDAEQALQRSQEAATELAAFSQSGVETLNRVSSDLRRWRDSAEALSRLARDVDRLLNSTATVDLPEIDNYLAGVLSASGAAQSETDFHTPWEKVGPLLRSAKEEIVSANAAIRCITDALETNEQEVRVQVNRKLADHGLDGARINQLQALNVQASLLESYQAILNQARETMDEAGRLFKRLRTERQALADQQRNAFDRVIEKVHSQFDGRIAAHRINDGRKEPLERFLRDLSQRGITRWWNDLTVDEQRPTPDYLLEKLHAGHLEDTGMSEKVQETFRLQLNPSKQRELAALRCRDHYVLKFKMDDGSHRPLENLSGGQRVNLLLTLLLETNDDGPLVIDQPEDELDNRFLFETMLPVLKRLKGRRQIILATHNANIVVNGDADQVIQLEATADRGRVARSGAIEEPAVRDAILQTVDGGDEAFRLRRLKYGF